MNSSAAVIDSAILRWFFGTGWTLSTTGSSSTSGVGGVGSFEFTNQGFNYNSAPTLTAFRHAVLKDITGKLIQSRYLPVNNGNIIIDGRYFNTGVYIVSVQTKFGTSTIKSRLL